MIMKKITHELMTKNGCDIRLADSLIRHSSWGEHSFLRFCEENRHRMGESILNIGICNDDCSHSWISFFLEVLKFKKVIILEAHIPNFESVKEKFKSDDRVEVIFGDARTASTHILEKVDCTFWWHGPEHIPASDLPQAYTECKKITNNAIIWSCPWGDYYALVGQYPADYHHFFPENEQFSDLGMTVVNTGAPKNEGASSILAYSFF